MKHFEQLVKLGDSLGVGKRLKEVLSIQPSNITGQEDVWRQLRDPNHRIRKHALVHHNAHRGYLLRMVYKQGHALTGRGPG